MGPARFGAVLVTLLVLLGALAALFAGSVGAGITALVALGIILAAVGWGWGSHPSASGVRREHGGNAPDRVRPVVDVGDEGWLIRVPGETALVEAPGGRELNPTDGAAATPTPPGRLIEVQPGQLIPDDGVVVAGSAVVDESAVTGESSAVLREAGGGRAAVLGGTRVVSGQVLVRMPAGRGDSSPAGRGPGAGNPGPGPVG
jgi:hypothetical protein